MAKAKRTATKTNGETVLTEDITHEVVTPTTTEPAEVPTIESTVKNEVAKFNLPRVAIAELKKQYSGLTISGLEDKKGYEAVRVARSEVRTKRTGIEKKRVELNSDYLAMQRAINNEAKELTALLLEVEEPLAAELKRIDDEAERIKREAEEAAQKKLQGRVAELLENGMQFNGNYYAIGDTISLDVVTLKNLPDEAFTGLLDRVKGENAAIIEAKAKKEREEREEKERLEKQRQDQEAEQKRLLEERQQFEKEKAELKAQLKKGREEQLFSWGLIPAIGGRWLLKKEAGEVSLVPDFDAPAEVWKEKLEEAVKLIAVLNEQQAEMDVEKQKKFQRDADRKTALFNLGFKYANGQFFINTESYGDSNHYSERQILPMDEKEWNEFIKTASNLINETRRQDAEFKEHEKRTKDREAELFGLGFVFDGFGKGWVKTFPLAGETFQVEDFEAESLDAEQWEQLTSKIKANISEALEKEREAAETLRRSKLSETEKVKEFLAEFSDVMRKAPKIEDAATASSLGVFIAAVSEAHLQLENAIK